MPVTRWTPCLNCTERKVGCHSVCKPYAVFYNSNREKTKQRIMNNIIDGSGKPEPVKTLPKTFEKRGKRV